LFDSTNDSLAISIAGIHSTIISILIGLGIAFVLHINTQIIEAETDALKIAESVNEIQLSPAWFKLMSPTSKFLENWESQDDQIQYWLADYWKVPTGLSKENIDCPPFKVYFSDFSLNHTEIKLCLMSALVLRYPFPERMVMKNSRYFGLQPTPTVIFSNVKEIRKWKLLVDEKFHAIAANINWFGVESFTQGFDWTNEIRLHDKFWKNDPEGYSRKILQDFQKLPNEFCLAVTKIFNIARAIDYKISRLNYFEKVSPSKIMIIIILLGAILTFFCGVIVPIICSSVSRFLVIWIPTLFYTFFLVYLSVKIFDLIER